MEVAGKELPNKSSSYTPSFTSILLSFSPFYQVVLQVLGSPRSEECFWINLCEFGSFGFPFDCSGVATGARVLQVEVHRELSFDPLSAPNLLG